jgi:hypothetical protein
MLHISALGSLSVLSACGGVAFLTPLRRSSSFGERVAAAA